MSRTVRKLSLKRGFPPPESIQHAVDPFGRRISTPTAHAAHLFEVHLGPFGTPFGDHFGPRLGDRLETLGEQDGSKNMDFQRIWDPVLVFSRERQRRVPVVHPWGSLGKSTRSVTFFEQIPTTRATGAARKGVRPGTSTGSRKTSQKAPKR